MAEHAELIDEVELSVGLGLSNVSHGLIDLDRDGSEWGPGYRIKPEEWLSHYVPDLLAVLKPHTEIMIPFFFGQGKDNNATQVAQQGYANADALAAQMVQLATDHDWISGYLLDYEVYCGETVESRAQCVPLEAERLTAFFKTLSTALHAKGKKLGFCTNKNGAGFEHWPYYSQYLAAGVDRLYEMGTYLNHTKHGGPSDRENVTQQLFTYPLQHTAFGLGDDGLVDTTEEAAAWFTSSTHRVQRWKGICRCTCSTSLVRGHQLRAPISAEGSTTAVPARQWTGGRCSSNFTPGTCISLRVLCTTIGDRVAVSRQRQHDATPHSFSYVYASSRKPS